tara:strand:- start:195 stop:1031 length:837 start_codon:yes stop_codon:yes gene_type:complete
MLTKTRHNKKRNTAFLYEALVRELTKSIVAKDNNKKNKIISIIKEFFSAGKPLKKELDLYKDLYENSSLHPYMCEKLIHEIKKSHSLLDKKEIFNEQTSLINKINKLLSKQVFSNFVPNYKNLATISQILNPDVSAKSRVLLESKIVESLSSNTDPSSGAMVPIDNIVYSTFVKKFNDQYGDGLLDEQKELLSKYIASFHDDSVDLKIFLNEEISRLNNSLANAKSRALENNNALLAENVDKVLNVLGSFASSEVDLDAIRQILKIQNLERELVANDD